MNRREFLQVLTIAGASGMTFPASAAQAAKSAEAMYDLPRFGNVHLLHFTDCHAQLRPVYFREPNVNLGIGAYAASRRISSAMPCCVTTASAPARRRRMHSRTSTSRKPRSAMARWAGLPIWPRWSSA